MPMPDHLQRSNGSSLSATIGSEAEGTHRKLRNMDKAVCEGANVHKAAIALDRPLQGKQAVVFVKSEQTGVSLYARSFYS